LRERGGRESEKKEMTRVSICIREMAWFSSPANQRNAQVELTGLKEVNNGRGKVSQVGKRSNIACRF